jgi:hypothetical protein
VTWHRGLLVCCNDDAEAVEAALVKQAFACRLTRQGVETAFAFAARNMPEFGTRIVQCAGIDGGSTSLVVIADPQFRARNLIIRVGYTAGLSLHAKDAHGLLKESPLGALFRSLGKPSDESIDGGVAAFRWDIDEAPLHSSGIDNVSRALHAMADILEVQDVEYRINVFDAGFGATRGNLEESEAVYGGPDVYITINWTDLSGSPNFVTANTGEFSACGDDVPDAELWHQ